MTGNVARGSCPVRQASVAVDLGAESCRVSLLRWRGQSPHVELVHRFLNQPVHAADGSLRWPLTTIVQGVEDGLRLCAERATEGIASIGVDGWAVDYVRLDNDGVPLEEPFCYRDERTVAAEELLHRRIPAERLHEITGLQPQSLNTVYQLVADQMAGKPAGACWLNLPEYFLSRWCGVRVAEYTNATHTSLVDLATRSWSQEILAAATIDPSTMPALTHPGTVLGEMRGPLAKHPALRSAKIIAPACHDTASAIHGIPAREGRWGYVSSGTWSLVGRPMARPLHDAAARRAGFTNLGLDADRYMVQKNVNGMWLLKQCMNEWEREGHAWRIEDLIAEASAQPVPETLLDVDDPDLLRMHRMTARIHAQLAARGARALDTSAAAAPAMTALILHSLAARYAEVFDALEKLTGESLERIYFVGGGSRNKLLLELTARATGREVIAGSPESSTVGNFALQLAALETRAGESIKEATSRFAAMICENSAQENVA